MKHLIITAVATVKHLEEATREGNILEYNTTLLWSDGTEASKLIGHSKILARNYEHFTEELKARALKHVGLTIEKVETITIDTINHKA